MSSSPMQHTPEDQEMRVVPISFVQNPGQQPASLPLLTEAERQRLLVEWNATAQAYPAEQCLHQLFEAQVERTPEAVAVVCADEQLTYRDLNRQANQLAHYLQRLGVGPEVLVGLCLERSLPLVVALLGILKAGGAYVPLDPTYPRERLAFMLHDAQVRVLLTQEHLVTGLPEHQAEVFCLDRDWRRLAQESTENPANRLKPENLAYVIYTSGSTGRPKGVMVQQKGLVNVLYSMCQQPGITSEDVLVAVTSLSFDIAALEIFLPLIVGARVGVATQAMTSDGAQLMAGLMKFKATIMQATPATWRLLLSSGWQGDPGLHVLCGGENLPAELAAQLLNNNISVWNLYGPTETTIWSTIHKVNYTDSPIPIGRPIANTQVYILDRYLNPVPIGVAGELHIGGDGLARGYLNQPELTNAKFIPHPWNSEPGARLYKTGDLARYLPDGTIEFLGRLDHQVKLRGFRIELGEIEAVLGQHPAVRETVVVAREDTPHDKRLVAYVVLQQRITVPELRRFLQEQLPDYMVPAAFVLLDALPLTPNGKVDRRALPAPVAARPEQEETFVAPRTATEEVLVSIWTEVLGFERIGIYDNFFDLGGHSLAATRIVSRVRESFQVELPLRWFFDAPGIAELARVLEENDHAELDQQFFPLQPAPRDGYLPLSFAQKRVWFIQQLIPMNIAYIAPTTLRVTGVLDVAVLEQCINELIWRHEVLRTTFPSVDGQPVQLIHTPQPMNLPLIDLRMFPEIERAMEAQRLIEEEIRKPFDITQLPLIRWTLVRLDAQEHILVFVEHHLVHDGWSTNLLLGELFELYKAFSTGKPSPLPHLPIQFADFAYWQHRWMQGEMAQKQLAYWKEKLAGSPSLLELPTDRPRPPIPSFRGAKPRVQLPPSQCKALRTLCRQEGVTQFMALLAIFLILLHRYSKQEDICVGSGIANRRWRETESMLGMVINTVVLRTDLSGNPTFRELLKRVREVTLEASAHQDLPFEEVVKALQPKRNLSYNPLFQVMFSIHDAPMPHLELAGQTIELLEVLGNGSAKFDLNIVVIPRPEQPTGWNPKADSEGITMLWEYSSDLFDNCTIAQMADRYQTLLENILTDPAQRLSEYRF